MCVHFYVLADLARDISLLKSFFLSDDVRKDGLHLKLHLIEPK